MCMCDVHTEPPLYCYSLPSCRHFSVVLYIFTGMSQAAWGRAGMFLCRTELGSASTLPGVVSVRIVYAPIEEMERLFAVFS